MPIIIDNVELDENNVEFNYASDFVSHTNKMVYLTGKAGTGKTTFLKYLRETINKSMVILAPTGVAAINAGGQTIHSFFQIRPSVYIPKDARLRTIAVPSDSDKSTVFDHFKYSKEKLKIIKSLNLLVIDEISMVRCDLLDVIDTLLRVFRKRKSEPFGGVQVLLIGDTFQLPPIAKNDEWDILSRYYKSPFFFSANVIQKNKPVYIELKKIYRQKESKFIDLLNKVRVNQITNDDLSELNSKYNPAFIPDGNDKYVILATHNKIVDKTNLTKLSELETELKLFEATITGTFPDNITSTDRTLRLKENAQVMFTKNDRSKRFYNGKIGTIKKIKDKTIIVEIIDVEGETEEIKVEKEVWENIKYKWDEEAKKIEEEIIGTFTQYPLKLAWAITVHKSQGLTFEKVIADLGSAFAAGQVYVALSRCTSSNGLILKSPIKRHAIKTDSNVLRFAQNETPDTLILEELNSIRADRLYKKARKKLAKHKFASAYDDLLQAIKFRNDIETKTFKRYMVALLSRYSNKKISVNQINKQMTGLRTKNTELSRKLSESQNNLKNKSSERERQNKALKLLLNKTDEYDSENKKLKTEIKAVKNSKIKISNELNNRNQLFENQNIKIKELEKIIAQLKR